MNGPHRYWLILLLASCARPVQQAGSPLPRASSALDSLRQADWHDRQAVFAVFRQRGFQSAAADTANRWLLRQDSARLAAFGQLEHRYGWTALTQAGPRAASVAYVLLQHAPDSVQVRYLPRVGKLYETGQLSPPDYAAYLDRALLSQGQPQQFGTQWVRLSRPDGTQLDSLLPTADFGTVDQRRRRMKLPRLHPQLQPGTHYFKPAHQ